MTTAPIHGSCAPGFEALRDTFAENFSERGEVGASWCVVRDGEVVVDLWGGWCDGARARPWQGDTLVNMYSVGKALAATLVLQLVDDGRLGLDQPVAGVWPEFAAGGKSTVTIRQALSHRAGVPAIRRPLVDADMYDWTTMADAVAATETWWPIGTRHAYHTNTYGFLTGEIGRRLTGDLPGTSLRRIADGLDGEGGGDIWFGVPPVEQGRCADVIWAPSSDTPTPAGPIDTSGLEGDVLMNVLAHFNPPGGSSIGVVNTERWRSAQIPSTNGHASARGVAAFYSALLEPGRLLSAELLAEATRPQSVGPCPILGDDVSFGLGFTPTTSRRPLGPNPRSFGHFGTGGALGFGDPDAGIAFGYVMNHVVPRWQSSRNRALIDALYALAS